MCSIIIIQIRRLHRIIGASQTQRFISQLILCAQLMWIKNVMYIAYCTCIITLIDFILYPWSTLTQIPYTYSRVLSDYCLSPGIIHSKSSTSPGGPHSTWKTHSLFIMINYSAQVSWACMLKTVCVQKVHVHLCVITWTLYKEGVLVVA